MIRSKKKFIVSNNLPQNRANTRFVTLGIMLTTSAIAVGDNTIPYLGFARNSTLNGNISKFPKPISIQLDNNHRKTLSVRTCRIPCNGFPDPAACNTRDGHFPIHNPPIPAATANANNNHRYPSISTSNHNPAPHANTVAESTLTITAFENKSPRSDEG